MADIELVIKIPEKFYEGVKYGRSANNLINNVIKNGTPLPKGHGRLKDIDVILDTLGCSDRDIYVRECIEEDSPTIIEADKEENDDREMQQQSLNYADEDTLMLAT